jgi:hypothetical protein
VDAAGRELPARLEVCGATCLAVVVEDAAATYPVRIDPTFSDADWTSLGGFPGADNGISAIVTDSSGNLYNAGYFSLVRDVMANAIAKWDGNTWSALGSGLNGDVEALAVLGTNLYAGGYFSTAGGISAPSIARWSGSAWSALGTGMDAEVDALAVSGTSLYAAGQLTTAGATLAHCIAKWDGSDWSAIGIGMNDQVWALALSGTDLYAGGLFTTSKHSANRRRVRAHGLQMGNWPRCRPRPLTRRRVCRMFTNGLTRADNGKEEMAYDAQGGGSVPLPRQYRRTTVGGRKGEGRSRITTRYRYCPHRRHIQRLEPCQGHSDAVYKGCTKEAQRMHTLLELVQPLCIRCAPLVHGAIP